MKRQVAVRQLVGGLLTVRSCGFTAVALVVFVSAAFAQAENGGDVQSALPVLKKSLEQVTAARDKLVARLDARTSEDAKKAPLRDLALRLPEGADREEMDLVLRQCAGAWAAPYAVVPAWRQESFQEKFRYYHRGATHPNTRDKIRYEVDGSLLKWDGARLSGALMAQLKLNESYEERFPAGTPVRWKSSGEIWTQMEVMGLLAHQKPRVQRYEVEAAVVPDVQEFVLDLPNGVIRAALHVTCQVPAQPWVRPTASTPEWNAGNHDVDATGLTRKDGRLTGILKVQLNPDKWYPKAPQKVAYSVDVATEAGYIRGTFKATGDMGEFDGPVNGRVGRFVRGSYKASGTLGSYQSEIFGRAWESRAQSGDLVADAKDAAPVDPAESAVALATRIANVYHHVRALHLALRSYPLSLEDALVQTEIPTPNWTTADGKTLTNGAPAAMQVFAQALATAASNALSETPAKFAVGAIVPVDAAFGPFFDTVALERDASGACALPPQMGTKGPQKWGFISEWRMLGPLPVTDDFDDDFAELPDVALCEAAQYPIVTQYLPKEKKPKEGQVFRAWESIPCEGGRMSVWWSKEPDRGASPGSMWFATADLVSDQDREVWVAASARDHGKLWVNGKLAWVGGEEQWRTHAGRDAIFQVRLNKGANRLLLRCREDRLWTWMRFNVCVRGEPGDPTKLPPVPTVAPVTIVDARGDGAGRFEKADPPLAWDLDKGINVAWRKTLPGQLGGGPTAVDGKLLCCAHPNTLLCLDQKTGETLWERDCSILELTNKDAFAKWQALKTDKEKTDFLSGLKMRSDTAPNAPLSDGKLVWVLFNTGVVAAHDMDGNRKWMVNVNPSGVKMCVTDGLVLLEWGVKGAKGGPDKPGTHRMLALDAATGAVKWEKDVPGNFDGGDLHVLRLAGPGCSRNVVLNGSLQVIDPATGALLLARIDADPSPGSSVYVTEDAIYFGKLSRTVAMRFILDKDGQVGQRFMWRNHYGIKYDRSTPLHAHGKWLMVCCTVQEDCPGHSPAPLRELYAYDEATGVPGIRIKPVLRQANDNVPTSAGPFVFVHDGGGAVSGGGSSSGQMAVVRADGEPNLICNNLLELGTSAPPVFDGNRMFLRKGSTFTCVAVTTPEGRRYQDERIATTLFEELCDPPAETTYAPVALLPQRPDPAKTPIALLENGRGLLEWLVTGPFDAAKDAKLDERLAVLHAENGATLDVGGQTLTFKPLSQEFTTATFSYGHSYYLDGLGGDIAFLAKRMNLVSAGGKPDSSLILHTVVANARSRVAKVDAPETGLDIWVGGRKVRASETVRLDAGWIPVTLHVRPELLATAPIVTFAFRGDDAVAARNVYDPVAARNVWLAKVRAHRDALKRIASEMSGSEMGKKAEMFLSQLEK